MLREVSADADVASVDEAEDPFGSWYCCSLLCAQPILLHEKKGSSLKKTNLKTPLTHLRSHEQDEIGSNHQDQVQGLLFRCSLARLCKAQLNSPVRWQPPAIESAAVLCDDKTTPCVAGGEHGLVRIRRDEPHHRPGHRKIESKQASGNPNRQGTHEGLNRILTISLMAAMNAMCLRTLRLRADRLHNKPAAKCRAVVCHNAHRKSEHDYRTDKTQNVRDYRLWNLRQPYKLNKMLEDAPIRNRRSPHQRI